MCSASPRRRASSICPTRSSCTPWPTAPTSSRPTRRRALGFATGTGDWRALVANPEIDLVDITAPNALHKEMALAAIAAGKHVYCEKPLAPLAADAREMADAAEAAGVKTQVGFNYLCNPMLGLAREMIAAGELGEIRSYRGIHAEDYMADAASPFSFRNDPVGGGALADLGSHALATAEYLLGPIAEVLGDCATVIRSRPDGKGGARAVETDDVGRAFLRFASGATGSVEASWIAMGRKMQHDFEVYGSKGSARSSARSASTSCTSTAPPIRPGAAASAASRLVPTTRPTASSASRPGHQLGFNDLKAIEVARYLDAIAGRSAEPFNFRAGLRIQQLVETIHRSSREGGWQVCNNR